MILYRTTINTTIQSKKITIFSSNYFFQMIIQKDAMSLRCNLKTADKKGIIIFISLLSDGRGNKPATTSKYTKKRSYDILLHELPTT